MRSNPYSEATILQYVTIAVDFAKQANVTGFYRSSNLNGRAIILDDGSRAIRTPLPRTPSSLFTMLHEIAHHYFDHERKNVPANLQELEANTKAWKIMAAHDIHLPPKEVEYARLHVERMIAKDRKAGIKIDPRAARFAATGKFNARDVP